MNKKEVLDQINCLADMQINNYVLADIRNQCSRQIGFKTWDTLYYSIENRVNFRVRLQVSDQVHIQIKNTS